MGSRFAGELKASECEQSGSVCTGEIAEVADADKAPGQHMLAKAAEELASVERNRISVGNWLLFTRMPRLRKSC